MARKRFTQQNPRRERNIINPEKWVGKVVPFDMKNYSDYRGWDTEYFICYGTGKMCRMEQDWGNEGYDYDTWLWVQFRCSWYYDEMYWSAEGIELYLKDTPCPENYSETIADDPAVPSFYRQFM